YSGPGANNPNDTGKQVKIVGVKPGLIRLEVYLKTPDGKESLVETYDAVVVKPHVVYYRAQILLTSNAHEVTAGQLAAQKLRVALANVYLRQAGIELRPDRTPDKFDSPGLKVTKLDAGIFSLGLAEKAPNDLANFFKQPDEVG